MIVGIDLGTSTSEVAVLKHGRPVLLREVRGSSHGILPSVVGVGTDGRLQVGDLAVNQLVLKPEFTTEEVKRKMGSDERIRLGGEDYSPQEVSALILRHLKEEAEKALGTPVTEAVITVPAYFNAIQRRATHEAGELAGLTVRRLVNEPTAAALAYGLDRPDVEEKIVVYDFGGGTLDVTLLELSEGVLDVLASTGNDRLGGKDFDERLMQLLHDECQRATEIDLFSTLRLKQRLKGAARKAKEELSSLESTSVIMDNIGIAPSGEFLDFEYVVSRASLEGLVRDLVLSTQAQLDEALGVKGLVPGDVDKILMVGGSTRVPCVRQFVSEYFGGRPLLGELSPDEAVALGAAVLAGIESRELDPERIVVTDVSPWTLGVAVLEDVGGEPVSDVFSPLIEKQSTIPRTAKKTYRTAVDWQRSVSVRVYQGDAPLCKDNVLVGSFQLDEFPPAPAGQEIEIEFSYNLNNQVEVLARHVASGRQKRASMQPSRAHLSGTEKDSAREKLDRVWARGRDKAGPTTSAGSVERTASQAPTPTWQASRLYGRVAPVMHQAEKRLPTLDPTQRDRVSGLFEGLKQALLTNDETQVRQLEERLIDLLFELE